MRQIIDDKKLINVIHVVRVTSIYGGHVISSIGISYFLSKLSELNISLYLDTTEKKIELPDLPKRTIVLNSSSPLKFLIKLYRNFKIDNPDIIHIHGAWSLITLLSCIYGYLFNIPYVIHTHGMLSTWSIQHKYIKKNIALFLYQKWCLKKSQLIFLTSLSEYNDLCKIVLNVNSIVINQGIFFQIPKIIDRFLKDPKRIRNVLFLSRLHPVKGIYELLEAWKVLNPSNWVLNIAGPNEGNTLDKVMAFIKLHNLDNSVKVLGAADSFLRFKLFSSADLFILPSHSENFGIVILESLSFGVPVITTKNTPWKTLEDNACGWWVDMNINALYSALDQAISLSDVERENMGKRGFELSQKYDNGLLSKKILLEYLRLLR
jgi:glycosyltransferase involved in cell wall biosynthesis